VELVTDKVNLVTFKMFGNITDLTDTLVLIDEFHELGPNSEEEK
jgi:hypothetical protein